MTPRPARLLRAALFCLACLLAMPAVAAERYTVELIVFAQGGKARTAEYWQPMVVVPDYRQARAFSANVSVKGATLQPPPEDFERLPANEGRLTDAVEELRASPRYRVLAHIRWRQPALEPGEGIPIRIRAGQPMQIDVPASMIARPVPAADNAPGRAPKPEDGMQKRRAPHAAGDTTLRRDTRDTLASNAPIRWRTVSIYPLAGTVELVVSRYLHLRADLYYTAPVAWKRVVLPPTRKLATAANTHRATSPESTETAGMRAHRGHSKPIPRGPRGQAVISFPFTQNRTMEGGELHYLDHPRLGMLALVTPYEPADESSE